MRYRDQRVSVRYPEHVLIRDRFLAAQRHVQWGMPKVTTLVMNEENAPTEAASSEMVNFSENTVLRLAASVEQLSTHILAHAVVEAAQERILPLGTVRNFKEIFGKGVQGLVSFASIESEAPDPPTMNKAIQVAVGNRTFMKHLDIAIPSTLLAEREQRAILGQIGSFVALDGVVTAHLQLTLH